MASTRKSPTSSTLAAHVTAVLKQHVPRGARVVAGLSGGVDSVVLLDLLQRGSKKLHFGLAALHVNHQINPAAARWATFCRALCKKRGIKCTVVRVTVPRGNSLEAAARSARYRAFAAVPADFVVLAHNLDDQAETVLLQLLRGAGVKGLSAMPIVREEGGGRREERSRRTAKNRLTPHASPLTPAILRPLLDVTRAEIEEYAHRRGLEWVEDESNEDIYFQRNFLRHRVLPVIAQRFPAYRSTIARAARHLAETARLLDALAANDGAGYLDGGTLAVDALRRLPFPRARNLLRYFLASRGVSMPGVERLDEALRQALTAKQDARVLIELVDANLRRYAGRLHVVRSGPLPVRYARRWGGENNIALPELGGVLVLSRGRGAGISLAKLQGRPVMIRVRRGGERLQPDCGRPRRSLKNLLQEARVPRGGASGHR